MNKAQGTLYTGTLSSVKGKCKVLLLGRWKGVLQQEDIPLPYLKITDHLDYLGVKLYADYSTTRRVNGEPMQKIVKDQMNS